MEGRVAGIIVLVCAIVVGVLMYRHYLAGEASAPAVVAPPEAPISEKAETRVRVTVDACKREYGRTTLRGHIVNSGNMPLHYVTMRAIWKNETGLEIGSDTFYALNDGNLAPGGQVSFEHSTSLTSAALCNAEVVDWW